MGTVASNASMTADVLPEVQRGQDELGDRVDVRSVMEVSIPYQLCYYLLFDPRCLLLRRTPST